MNSDQVKKDLDRMEKYREYQREYHKKYYQKHKEKFREEQKKYRVKSHFPVGHPKKADVIYI